MTLQCMLNNSHCVESGTHEKHVIYCRETIQTPSLVCRTEQLECVGSGDSRSSIQEGLNEIITAGTQQLQLGGHIKESDMK